MSDKLLDPHTWEIYKLFDKKVYNVPVYQRPYSWDSENVEVLLNDIYSTYISDEKNDGYYTGNLLLHDKNEKIDGTNTVYQVIDGQQRITTITLMLLALYSLATINNGIDDYTYRDLKEFLWKTVNKRSPEKEYKVLNLNSTEKNCFNNLFDYAFDHPNSLYEYAKKYETKTQGEIYVISNFLLIYNFLMRKSEMILMKF